MVLDCGRMLMIDDWILSLNYAAWLAASTMPLGFMLGSPCSPCCNEEEELPCNCLYPFPNGLVATVSASITFPNVAGDCPAGQYAVAFDLVDVGGLYAGQGEIDLGNSIIVCVVFELLCNSGVWTATLYVFTSPCAGFLSCTIGGGGFAAAIGSLSVPSYVQDEGCLPSPLTFSAELAHGVVYDFALTFK